MKSQKNPNKTIYITLSVLLIAVVLLAYLNGGDAVLRRALEQNRKFQIRMDGTQVATVSLQDLLDLDPQEFTTTYATSISAPREAKVKGVELRVLLASLNIETSNAVLIIVSGLDSYNSPLTREEVERAETVYICYSMDGEILKTQAEGGFGPFLMIIRDSGFAQRWCKYVEAVDIRS